MGFSPRLGINFILDDLMGAVLGPCLKTLMPSSKAALNFSEVLMGGASRTLFRLTVVSPTVFTFKPSDLGNLTSVCFLTPGCKLHWGCPFNKWTLLCLVGEVQKE